MNDHAHDYYKYLTAKNGLSRDLVLFPLTKALTLEGSDDTNPFHKEAIGDYSGGEVTYSIQASSAHDTVITGINVYVEDSGSFDSGAYGNNIALTNGIEAGMITNGFSMSFPFKILKNSDFLINLGGTQDLITYGSGNEALRVNISLANSTDIVLLKGSGDKFFIKLHDDFTGLVSHRFVATGFTVVG